ncbi:protein arginine methyltransferase NDUFAF7 homolog, mitochondrial [Chrysoperla carnea]|uniref:protein arginine methyltransferase NDUFAF7 homolog, mitochondrial n=1 Tax=Chrysoperla carnea TaxID=189513 RepID=UPI001D08AA55|nr:protein arginine methyltransferase NDUFAF7 homolog, mitochondrial [Chrysoperla carnea]
MLRKILSHTPKQFYCTIAKNTHKNALNETNKLTRELAARMKLTGPITVADYMKEVLTNPSLGYYMNRDVFGERGDFVTSPEMGQMFGELIAVWFISELEKIGDPTPLQIIELGPGRGTLAADVLRVFRHIQKDRYPFISLHLVEVSPYMREIQAKTLRVSLNEEYSIQHNTKTNSSNIEVNHSKTGVTPDGLYVYWYDSIEDVPKNFSILVAHEFFDVLPIHKIKKTANGWREILIDYSEKDKQFKYVLSPTATAISSSKLIDELHEDRNEFEISPKALTIIEHIASRFENDGGIGLIVDYGHMGDKRDTFRAYKKHKQYNPLLNPGTADLTADVDFKQLIKYATKDQKLLAFGPVTQSAFLNSLGIKIRLDMLIKNAKNQQQIDSLKQAYKVMTDADQMGERFKFISLFPSILGEHLKKFPVAGFQ